MIWAVRLCRTAYRTSDDWWRVIRAHMNSEMARMNEDFVLANQLYDESMLLSKSIGKEIMVATECFNKSFIAVAQRDFTQARNLINQHFEIRGQLDDGDINS